MRPTHGPPPPEVREQARRNRPLVRLLRRWIRTAPTEEDPDLRRDYDELMGNRVRFREPEDFR